MIYAVLFLVLVLVTPGTGEDYFTHWFDDQYAEILDNPKPLEVSGTVPSYITGRLIRVGPTQVRTENKNYTNFLDGFGRVSSWRIDGANNKVDFLSAFIRSSLFNASKPTDEGEGGVASDIARHITQQPTAPKTRTGLFELGWMDNTDVNVYRFGKEESFLAFTDFAEANLLHLNSLRTLGKPETTGAPDDTFFSGSHPWEWVDPSSGETKLVNWLGKKSVGGSVLYVYTMGVDGVKTVVGSTKLDFQPYSIHSLAVAGDFVVVTIGPVGLDFLKAGATLCLSCSADDKMDKSPMLIKVFALTGEGLGEDKGPVANVEMDDALFVFHHTNAMINDSGTQIHLDYCAYSSTDGWLGEYVLGDVADMMNPDTRNSMPQQCDKFTRVTVDVSTEEVVERLDLPLRDAAGNTYTTELHAVNPILSGKEYCWVYALSYHVKGSPKLEDMGIIKIDACGARQAAKSGDESAVTVADMYHVAGVYVGEPIFVPNPTGTSEDDGTLLVVSREMDVTRLLMIDARTMDAVAKVTAPFPLMFEFHGQFFAGLD